LCLLNDILTVAIENLWLDDTELQDLLQYPLALATAATFNNHLNFLRYFDAEHSVDVARLESLSFTFINGHLDMIKWLNECGQNHCTTHTLRHALPMHTELVVLTQ
ncbi:hypothetical protein THRCLA_22715, partial [Thraustotheca clavata]